MAKRIERVNELLKEEIGNILLKDVEFPEGVLATITRVEVSPNMFEAKVFISVFPDNKTDNVFNILNKIIYGIQQKINSRLRMRPIPRISFVREEKTREAARVEELIDETKKE